MKFILSLFAIGAIALAGWYLLNSDTASIPEENEVFEDTESMDDNEANGVDTTDTDDATSEDTEDESSDDEVVFDVTGSNFEFDTEEIRVSEGDTVTINFTSTGGMHDWVVDEFDAATEIVNEGESTSVTFVADEAGSYEFYCSVGSHRDMGMVGELIVE